MSTKGTCSLRVSVGTMRQGPKTRPCARPESLSLNSLSPPCLLSLDKMSPFVECGRRRCRREGLLQYANPQLCFEGERRGSTVWRQLTLLPRANRRTLADFVETNLSFGETKFKQSPLVQHVAQSRLGGT
jgi:hypothetical protein